MIVGVNKYRRDKEEPIDILDVDNVKVRAGQVARLERIRAERDDAACEAALAELTRRSAEGGNLLDAAVEAARARATVGEISMAMEKEFGRHRAEVKTLSGVYGAAYEATRALPISRNQSMSSPRPKAAARVCWWSRWAKTGTTGGPR